MIAYYRPWPPTTKPDGKKGAARRPPTRPSPTDGELPPGTPAGADAASTGEELNNLDTPESGVQSVVHVRLGKLNMVKGTSPPHISTTRQGRG